MSAQPSYRVLVTGSRTWTDVNTIRDALLQARSEAGERPITVVHGACPRGADAAAALLADTAHPSLRIAAEAHPADWRLNGRAAGFIRNQHMVNLGADVCLAFIKDGSRGASHTAALADEAGIPVRRWIA